MKTPHVPCPRAARQALAIVASLLAGVQILSAANWSSNPAAHAQILRASGPLRFEENVGQTDPTVRFLSRSGRSTLFLAPGGSTLVVRSEKAAAALRMTLTGAKADPAIEGLDPLAGTVNSFIGSDPAQWRTQIPTFARAAYRDVWPGVDLVYHGQQGRLEYDFLVAPGGDPAAIRMHFAGAEKIEVDARGDLVLHIAGGSVRQLAPVTYQETAEGRRVITSHYVLHTAEEVGFEVADYDPALPLTIDPVLWYSTYWGGGFSDRVNGIAVDSSRNCYVTGATGSSNFPRSAGPLDNTYNGNDDVFVSKFGPTNSAAETPALIYSTFLGGSGDDAGNGIAADSAGRAYVVGDTESANFPTQAAMQNNLRGFSDAFVTKLDATGDSMLFSTYVGGFDADVGHGIAVRNTQVHITGHTFSAQTFPVNGQYQRFGRGGIEAFVSKFTAAGNALIYSTLLGGGETDDALAIAVDTSGIMYVTGYTDSTNFPLKSPPGQSLPPFQSAARGRDAFVAKIDPNSTGENSLIYSTRLGGSSTDSGEAITVDSAQRAYVTGDTFSADFPLKLSQRTAAESSDAYVTKFNADGTSVFYSILLGGSASDGGRGIALDSALNAWVTGFTFSPEFPQSADRLQPGLRPSQDPFVTQIVPKTLMFNGQTFVFAFGAGFSTLFGGEDTDGSSSEGGNGIAVDLNNDIYFAGSTSSTGFPLLNPRQTSFGGGSNDGFVAKIGRVDQPPAVTCTVATPSLWPPNSRLVNVGLNVSATDDHDPNPVVSISVFSDETDVDTGGGAVVSPDAGNFASGALTLRAERQGNGDGRVYLILVTAADAAGNVGYTCCTVTVPHSQSAKARADVAAQAAAAEAQCAGSGTPPAGYFLLSPVPVAAARR